MRYVKRQTSNEKNALGKGIIYTANAEVVMDTQNSMLVPKGPTSERPQFAENGHMRYNTDVEEFEFYQDDLEPIVERFTSLYAKTDEMHDPATCSVADADLLTRRGVEVGRREGLAVARPRRVAAGGAGLAAAGVLAAALVVLGHVRTPRGRCARHRPVTARCCARPGTAPDRRPSVPAPAYWPATGR